MGLLIMDCVIEAQSSRETIYGSKGDNKIHFIIYTPVSFSNLILTRFAFSGKYLR